MGKLEQKSDGYYVLEDVKVGVVNIPTKVFKEVDIPLDKVSKEPKANRFYLDIPDRK